MAHSNLLRKLTMVSPAIALAVFLSASQITSTSASVVQRSPLISVTSSDSLLSERHGSDEGHEEMHGASMTIENLPPVASTPSSWIEQHQTGISHSDNHYDMGHSHHDMESSSSMYDVIPDPLFQSKDTFIPVPPLPIGAGGHSHGGHGAEEPKLELNETVIVRWKGPDPLSYIEWDFAYGIGRSEDLLRFSKAYNEKEEENVMGVGGDRWRTLLDENGRSKRLSIASDILQRVQANSDDPGRHRILLLLHVIGCIISCFVLLPIALALRSAESNLAPLASLVYLVSFAGSLFMSQLYKTMTPQLYPSNSHGRLGYVIFWMSLAALGGDVFRLLLQILKTFKSLRVSSKKMSLKTFMQAISLSTPKSTENYDALEEERMLSAQDGESDAQEVETTKKQKRSSSRSSSNEEFASNASSHSGHRVHFAQGQQQQEQQQQSEDPEIESCAKWPSHRSNSQRVSRDIPSPSSTLCNTPRTSIFGELHNHASPSIPWKLPLLFTENAEKRINQERVASWRQFDDQHVQRTSKPVPAAKRRSTKQLFKSIFRYSHVTVARSLPILSFGAAYSGLAVYTGSCRGPYGNTCMAHGIKGGIFFWYGLLSFGRYLGAYADLGWAWNKQPSVSKKGGSKAVSAEWVECLVIFIYGSTNTWMERFGAAPGDPYSVKQVQHISIAVMFWFAGLVGLILETKSFKNLLAIPVALKQAAIDEERSGRSGGGQFTCEEAISLPAQPPSYNFSFNPFPALVIGVTGVAMAAHHQDYAYEVSIHQLWGNLLAGFSIFRILTYFFLFLRPPTSSIMPSRPPTEALASFCLACGGLVFMLSSEEVSFVAMRNGFGDFMMILNLSVAIVSFVFCSIAGLMILKAIAVKREKNRQEASIRLEEFADNRDSPSNQPPPQSVFVLEDEEEETELQKREIVNSPVAIES